MGPILKNKRHEFLTFVFQVTYFQYVLVLYNVVNKFLLSFTIIQVSLKMLLKIVLFPFQILLSVGLYHLIFHKVPDQPVEMTKVSEPPPPSPPHHPSLQGSLVLDKNHVRDHLVSFPQYFSLIASNEE